MAEIQPAPDPLSTSLTPEEFAQLFDAFLDAFASKSELERVVAFSFTGVDLAEIADGDLRTVTAALIRWAEARGAIATLIVGARKENADNEALLAAEDYWRNRPPPSPEQLQAISPDGDSAGQDVPVGSRSAPSADRQGALRLALGAIAILCVIGAVWWLTHRDGTVPPAWQLESFPRNATGMWYGESWLTNPSRVQGLAEPSPNESSGFMRFRPQSRLAPATAERTLGDGISAPSLLPYCTLTFRLRLNLDGVNALPAGTEGASVYLKQGDADKVVALKQYVPHPESFDWQTVEIPRRAFERTGLDVALPVSALGFRFAMPLGNAVDIDDIAFNPCPASG